MIIFRPHRGSLADAMAEVKEFENEEQMKEHIVKDWQWFISFEDIVIGELLINDKRIGWKDTRYVCTKRMGNDDYMKIYHCPQCIGMCATDYK
jgi:hypothetical protein